MEDLPFLTTFLVLSFWVILLYALVPLIWRLNPLVACMAVFIGILGGILGGVWLLDQGINQ